jgi:acetyl esterase
MTVLGGGEAKKAEMLAVRPAAAAPTGWEKAALDRSWPSNRREQGRTANDERAALAEAAVAPPLLFLLLLLEPSCRKNQFRKDSLGWAAKGARVCCQVNIQSEARKRFFPTTKIVALAMGGRLVVGGAAAAAALGAATALLVSWWTSAPERQQAQPGRAHLPWSLLAQVRLLRGFGDLLHAALVRAPDPSTVAVWHVPVGEDGRTVAALAVFPPGRVPSAAALPSDAFYVNWHGGGFLGGRADDDSEFCRRLAAEAGCVVLACTYRFAPEYPYPAALEDCAGVLAWLRRQFPHSRIAVGGFSAGGTLALGVAQRFTGQIAAVVAFYPPVDFSAGSDNDFAEKDPYQRNLFHRAYLLSRPADLTDPVLSPAFAPASALPPKTVIIAAKVDPNIRDIERLMRRLAQERPLAFVGKVYDGMLHGWTYLPAFVLGKDGVRKKDDAFSVAIHEIKAALAAG